MKKLGQRQALYLCITLQCPAKAIVGHTPSDTSVKHYPVPPLSRRQDWQVQQNPMHIHGWKASVTSSVSWQGDSRKSQSSAWKFEEIHQWANQNTPQCRPPCCGKRLLKMAFTYLLSTTFHTWLPSYFHRHDHVPHKTQTVRCNPTDTLTSCKGFLWRWQLPRKHKCTHASSSSGTLFLKLKPLHWWHLKVAVAGTKVYGSSGRRTWGWGRSDGSAHH